MHQPHKMVKHTQTIREQHQTNCLGVYDTILWKLVLKACVRYFLSNFYFSIK